MISEKYLDQIRRIVSPFSRNNQADFFVFGSSLNEKKFGDIDIGVIGGISDDDLAALKGAFAESTLPYKIDLVKIDDTSSDFKNNVLNNKIIWLTR